MLKKVSILSCSHCGEDHLDLNIILSFSGYIAECPNTKKDIVVYKI